MKARTLLFVLASVALASTGSAAPSIHKITKAKGTQVCGKDTTDVTVSIVAPTGVHGTLRAEPVAAAQLAQKVSYTGNGTTVSVPLRFAGLGCSEIKGIKLDLDDDGTSFPKWLMPSETLYGAKQLGSTSTTHIERVQVRTSLGQSNFQIVLFGGTDGKHLQGTLRVRSVHSKAGVQSEERTISYTLEAGQGKVLTFARNFSNQVTLSAFNVYLDGATQPLVASRLKVVYSL